MHLKHMNTIKGVLLKKMLTWWLPLALFGGLPTLEPIGVSSSAAPLQL